MHYFGQWACLKPKLSRKAQLGQLCKIKTKTNIQENIKFMDYFVQMWSVKRSKKTVKAKILAYNYHSEDPQSDLSLKAGKISLF